MMLIWKKPIAIVFASAGVLVGTALPQLTFGQSNAPVQTVASASGSFAQDSQPPSTPAVPVAEATSPLTKSVSDSVSRLEKQITSLPKTNSPQNPETRSSQDFRPDKNEFESTGYLSPKQMAPPSAKPGLPTVIVRPPSNDSPAINDLVVNVERVTGGGDHDFAVRLMVPDSVKVIDVTPVYNPDSPRNFKIHLEQQSDQQRNQKRNGGIASNYSMPNAAPVHSASSLNAVQPRAQLQPLLPMMQLQSTPVETQFPTRHGFKKNPYFQPKNTNRRSEKQPLAATTVVPPIVDEWIESPPASTNHQNRPTQASYDASSAGSLSPSQLYGKASNVGYVDSLDSDSPIHTAMFGPNNMGLGDVGDFLIYVNNPTADTINKVVVRLDVPPGLDVVLLDREANFDETARTLTWQIPEVAPKQEHLIRYRVKSFLEGTQTQQVWVGNQGETQSSNEFETVVEVKFETPEAPLLHFESN